MCKPQFPESHAARGNLWYELRVYFRAENQICVFCPAGINVDSFHISPINVPQIKVDLSTEN